MEENTASPDRSTRSEANRISARRAVAKEDGISPVRGQSPAARPAQFVPFAAPGTVSLSRNIALVYDVVLRVAVELGRVNLPIREVLTLGPGSIVELERTAGEPVDILANGTPIAKGEVVVVGEKFGVRVTEVITPTNQAENPLSTQVVNA